MFRLYRYTIPAIVWFHCVTKKTNKFRWMSQIRDRFSANVNRSQEGRFSWGNPAVMSGFWRENPAVTKAAPLDIRMTVRELHRSDLPVYAIC